MTETNIDALKLQAAEAMAAGNFKLLAELSRQISKAQHELEAEMIKANQQKLEAVTKRMLDDISNEQSKLYKAVMPYYQQAVELVGQERAMFKLVYSQTELDISIVKTTKAKASGNSSYTSKKSEYSSTMLLEAVGGETIGAQKSKYITAYAQNSFTEASKLIAELPNDSFKNNAKYQLKLAMEKRYTEQKI